MDIPQIVVNIVSLLISIGLVYFAIKLLSIFKGGKMGKPWIYISSGALALALSSSIFAAYRFLDINTPSIRAIGAFIMMVGGLLILIGMYYESSIWGRNMRES